MKHLNNERGVTLIELLAALAIFLIFIGIIGSYSTQVQTFLADTKEHYFDKSDIRYVEMVLQDQLADPVEMNFKSGESLIWKTLDGECKALRFNSDTDTLYLYKNSCESLDKFTYGTGGEELSQKVTSFSLLNNGAPQPTKDMLIGRNYKLKFEYQKQIPIEYSFEILGKK